MRRLLKREITADQLTERDVIHDTVQKGVDMKLGIDIASIAYKKLADRVVLITGDCDFVPAARGPDAQEPRANSAAERVRQPTHVVGKSEKIKRKSRASLPVRSRTVHCKPLIFMVPPEAACKR